jgi:hypothetical protein
MIDISRVMHFNSPRLHLAVSKLHTALPFLNPEDGGDVCFGNAWLSTDYIALNLKR